MAFHFDRNETVAAGIKRLLQERLDGSIERFTKCVHPTDSVHDVRKDIKKVRAILRLVHSHLDRRAYRREMQTFREVARVLAMVRDTQVHLQTLKELSPLLKAGAKNHSFGTIKSILEKEQDRAQNNFSTADGKHTTLQLLRLAKDGIAELASCKLDDDWDTLNEGFLKSYKLGKKGLFDAKKNGRPEEFHEWRKAVKRLWYEMRLITPAWPVVIEAFSDELGRLGEALGADHDLFVLGTIIDQQPASALSKKQRAFLVSLIEERQRELRREALALGVQIYSEKPTYFCKRLERYWENWRRENW